MTIYNLGSINADYIYRVPHLPVPGETLAAATMNRELGGKGANQSVAAARAGSDVRHIGAVGEDGRWAIEELAAAGMTTEAVAVVNAPTAHAIINVDPQGENAIVIYPGANEKQSLTRLESALSTIGREDFLLLQNETNLQVEAARIARQAGAKVIYSAAPFSETAVQAVLSFTDILVMNAVEAEQLGALTVGPVQIVTRGADGADWIEGDVRTHVPAFPVTPVDTTGAGDCFIGYVAAGLDQGLSAEEAMRLGAAASAIQVERPGTAGAIPARAEVDAFLLEKSL